MAKNSSLKTYLRECCWTPLVITVVMNMLVYFGTKSLGGIVHFHNFTTPLDEMIPFQPIWMIVYVSAFLQWVIGFIAAAHEGREFATHVFSAELYAKLMTLVFFITLPSTLVRPEVTGSDPISLLTRFIYWVDTPMNLFPSVHCLASWFCVRTAWMACRSKAYRYTMLIWSLLVFASILLVKQHVLVDIAGGIAVLEIGFILVRYHEFSRLYARFEAPITRLMHAIINIIPGGK